MIKQCTETTKWDSLKKGTNNWKGEESLKEENKKDKQSCFIHVKRMRKVG